MIQKFLYQSNRRKKGWKWSAESRQRLSDSTKGKPKIHLRKPQSQEHLEKRRLALLGREISDLTKKKISDSLREYFKVNKAPKGENHWNWKGDSIRRTIRGMVRKLEKYNEWRTKVFIRDNRQCVKCSSKKTIEADHIVPLAFLLDKLNIKNIEGALNCEELWQVNNGRTLCQECHRKTRTYGGGTVKFIKNNLQVCPTK